MRPRSVSPAETSRIRISCPRSASVSSSPSRASSRRAIEESKMSEAYIGEIRSFGFNFAPYGWFQCNGQLLPISQYSALFSILGTTYGGNGTTNFALPNLQGNSPMHWGTGAGLNTVLGEVQGTSTVTLTPTQMPGHSHSVFAAEVAKDARAADRTAGPSAASYLAQSAGAFIYQTAPSTPNT